MDPVNGINQIVEILKRQLKSSSELTTSKVNKNKNKTDVAKKTRPGDEHSVLKSRLVERLKAITIEEENWKTKARLIFIESILMWEFGENIVSDNGFNELVKNVDEQITHNDKLLKKFELLILHLRS